MTEMKTNVIAFTQLENMESLHDRVTRALALHVIKAERNREEVVFPNEGELCRQLGVSRSILREAMDLRRACWKSHALPQTSPGELGF